MTAQLSRSGLTLLVVAPMVLAACGSSTSSNNPKPVADVAIVANAATRTTTAFSPDTFVVRIANGGKVTWRNDDSFAHTATADLLADSAAGFHTNTLAGGDTLTIDFSGFSANDTVHYHCTFHPTMVGVVIVKP